MKFNYGRIFLLGFGFFGVSVMVYFLFSTLAAIAGPNINGWVVQLTGKNYQNVMLVAPVFMLLAFIQMAGVRRGEAILASPATAD